MLGRLCNSWGPVGTRGTNTLPAGQERGRWSDHGGPVVCRVVGAGAPTGCQPPGPSRCLASPHFLKGELWSSVYSSQGPTAHPSLLPHRPQLLPPTGVRSPSPLCLCTCCSLPPLSQLALPGTNPPTFHALEVPHPSGQWRSPALRLPQNHVLTGAPKAAAGSWPGTVLNTSTRTCYTRRVQGLVGAP